MCQKEYIVTGQVLQFQGDPFTVKPSEAAHLFQQGAMHIKNGKLLRVGDKSDVISDHTKHVEIIDYADHLIMAGFVDCHVHYPQIDVIASYGAQLIEWLEKYTFPAESKFHDYDHALLAANKFIAENLRNGVTTASVFCTSHKQSVDAFFEACMPYNFRMIAGKVMMDRNAPEKLIDTAQSGYDDSKALIEKWHNKNRFSYAITPRFAPTSTPEQLEAAGALWKEYPDCIMQTHISENLKEIEWVQNLFPDSSDYLDVYETFGLCGERAIFGHGIHLSASERQRLSQKGAAIAHCPTSNLFIGSGLFKLHQTYKEDIKIGLACDVGGGSSFSPFNTMRAAYEIAQLNGHALHPMQAFYLSTIGSAEALYLSDKIGNLQEGFEADFIVLDLHSTPLIENRMRHAESIADILFCQMILADDRAIKATYVDGKKVYNRS